MGRLAMVTGASSGIGEEYAARLARDGWNLVVVARRADRLESLAGRLRRDHGVEVTPIAADLSQHQDLATVAHRAETLPLELLVNNAALAHYMPFSDLPPERAEELVHLNVLAPVLLTRAAVAPMRERGRGAVVNVASLLAYSGTLDAPHLPARAVYAASKSFLVTFSQLLAAELGGTGVRLQVVCPGVVHSEFHSRQGMDMSQAPRMEPEAVVDASLADLERGVVVCIPGLADESVLSRADHAHRELMGAARATQPAERYAR